MRIWLAIVCGVVADGRVGEDAFGPLRFRAFD